MRQLADRRSVAQTGLGLSVLGSVALVWRVLVFPPEPTSTPIRLVNPAPLRSASPAELPPPPRDTLRRARLLFAGDIMQHRLQANDDFKASYAGIAGIVRQADIAEANLEFPVDSTRPVGPPPGSAIFNGSGTHLDAIAGAGFDLLQTANNHAYDQGEDGVRHTLQALDGRGLQAIGTAPSLAELEASPVVVRDIRGLRVGFVAYSIVPNRYRKPDGTIAWPPRDMPLFAVNFDEWRDEYRRAGLSLFNQHVRLARERSVDFLVALVHWGEEWRMQPTADQRRAGRDLVDAGFDLVVGSHSHVLNPAEVYRGRLIAYSLGNLIADFRPYETRTGALLSVDVVQGRNEAARVTGFAWHPTLVDRKGHGIRLLDPAAGTADREGWRLARSVLGDGVVSASAGPEK